ncbi:MAG: NAD-dependent epimerase [Thermodesulfobacteriota bacterium]
MEVLVTGAAGFIGFHLSLRLLEEGFQVLGLDNLNDYYDVKLKEARLDLLRGYKAFSFERLDVADREALDRLFRRNRFPLVVHLAAQAGVRHSLTHPHDYIEANILGFLNILEGCRHQSTRHLVFASSSSVYGLNTRMPFSVHDNVDHPISLYAATKKANELMAHTYSHLYGLPATGLRFFTVYGPWGRPDMALFKFTQAICEDRPIQVFNYGDMERDFTYVDDVIESVFRILALTPQPDPGWSGDRPDPGSSPAPYRIYNVGSSNPVRLMDFIEEIEKALGRKAQKELMPLQPGDVPASFADVEDLFQAVNFRPVTPITAGISKFISWYREYYLEGTAAGSAL